jgi:excisionase family DNA binding protein
MSSINLDDLISQAEAARLRGVTRQAISFLVQRGKLNAYEIGGRVFVSRTEVKNFQEGPRGRPPLKATEKKKSRK